ncbi:glycosyltransferase [Patescibacteria group bacterium]|nr:glycosyltransferase [Patescibacteria group bacterium]
MKLALVHDYLIRFGGAERVLLEMAKMFPGAPIYTLLYDEQKMGKWFPSSRVQTSFLQKFPRWWRVRHKYLLPFLPAAVETFDLREFDLVISSSSVFAKGVVTRPKTTHINYCHNAARFLWDYNSDYLLEQSLGGLRGIAVKLMLNYIRLWDRSASRRVDYFIANSRATAARIKKFYRREAKVIYPPVEITNIFLNQRASRNPSLSTTHSSSVPLRGTPVFAQGRGSPAADNNYFLIVSQLTPYKKIDVAVEAFNKLELPLVIIGEGPQKESLQKIAKSNIKIFGWQPDNITQEYFKNCTAFIFPGEDDFGMAPVEAMKYGKPVLALKAGGALETVLPGITGEFFDAAVPEVLADGVRRLRENLPNYSSLVIRKWAEKFSAERFRSEILEFIEKVRYNLNNEI